MIGWALMGSTGGAILGPFVAAWLLNVGSYRTPFYFILILTVFGAALSLWLLPRVRHLSGNTTPIQAFLTERSVLVPALAVAVAAAGWGILEPLLPARLERMGGGSVTELGTLFTIATIAYGASAPAVSWVADRISVRRTIGLGIAGMAVCLPALSLVDAFWTVLLLLCGVAWFFAMLINPASAELGEAVERRGLTCYPAVYAVYNFAYAAGMVGTSSIAAAVASRIGFAMTMLIVSGGLLVTLPFVWRTPSETLR
jgi:MFS transporter, DHA1 family, solute carrier family 18 (vesicular amine transporter), member 1/2